MRVRDRISEGTSRERVRLEVRRALRPLAVLCAGLTAAALSLAFIVSQLNVPWPWEDTLDFRVPVDNAEGVVPGQHEVRVAGVTAGKITAVRLADGGAELEVSLDEEYAPVHRDARVRLRPQTQLQDMYLDIESRGTRAAGELRDGDALPAGRTRVAVHVNRVLDVFQPPVRRRFEQMLREMGEGLGDDGAQLRAAFVELAPFLRSAARLTGETAKRERLTRRLVRNSRLLFDELADRDRQLTQLVVAGGETLGELGARREPLGAIFTELPPLLEEIDESMAALRRALESVDPALVALQDPTRELAPALRALEAFSLDARPALTRLGPAVIELRPLAQVLAPASRELERAFRLLRPQAPAFDRITSDIAGCQLALEEFFHNTISVFKFGDAHGAYPRGESAQGIGTTGLLEPDLIRGESCARRGTGG